MKVVFKDGVWKPARGLKRFLFALGFAVLGPLGLWVAGMDIFVRSPQAGTALGLFTVLFFFGLLLSSIVIDD